jgi:quercetin dioxygenase-like cupin family protein
METLAPADATPAKQPAKVDILAALDLGHDIAALAGKELRLQLTTYAPGATGTPHSHEGKVEVVYALAGAITEHHRDGRVVTYRPGEAFTANKETFHHMANHGDVPAQMVVAMIVDKPR